MKLVTRRTLLLAASALGAVGLTAGLALADLPPPEVERVKKLCGDKAH